MTIHDFFKYEHLAKWVYTLLDVLNVMFEALTSTVGDLVTAPLELITNVFNPLGILGYIQYITKIVVDSLVIDITTGEPLTILQFATTGLFLYLGYQLLIWLLNLIT